MITEQDAALRAEVIIEYPADDTEQGWTLTEFPERGVRWLALHAVGRAARTCPEFSASVADDQRVIWQLAARIPGDR